MKKAHYIKALMKIILENPEFCPAFSSFINDRIAPLAMQCCTTNDNDERNRGAIASLKAIVDIKEVITKEVGCINLEEEDV